MMGSGSMSTSPTFGGGGQELVDHLRRGSLGDGGEPLDLEEVLEVLLGRFALVALTGENPEQVSTLGLRHRFVAVGRCSGTANRSGRSRGRGSAGYPRGTGWSDWPRTRSGAYFLGFQAHAI